MDYSLSKSEKKRRAKNIEKLAFELVELSTVDIKKLPCDDVIKDEIVAGKNLKAGARKRQIKYLTKNLRQIDADPLLDFMASKKGSHLKEKKEFHELENLRDSIINEALAAAKTAKEASTELGKQWDSPALLAASQEFPDLDLDAVRQSAWRYTRSRKAPQSREIFRLLKAAAERKRWNKKQGEM